MPYRDSKDSYIIKILKSQTDEDMGNTSQCH